MQFRKDVAIYIPGRAVGYGMAYCVHTICIETGFKLHFPPTRHQFKHQKTYFGGKWIVQISMKTIKNELVQSRNNDMHVPDFQILFSIHAYCSDILGLDPIYNHGIIDFAFGST